LKLPDLPYGDIGKAAIGATIAGIIAICIEITRRRREKKNRFQDEKPRIYKDFLHYNDLLFADIQLVAAFMPIYQRLMFPSGERNRADLERARKIVERLRRNLPKYREDLFETLTEMELIWPGSKEASSELTAVIARANQLDKQGKYEEIADLTDDYDRARASFRAKAQRDLGVDD
jgi:hypothetical protein